MYLGNGRQASATVPGPEERHRCFGPFEQAAQCKRDDHAANQALCPGVLIVGSVVTSVLVPTAVLAPWRAQKRSSCFLSCAKKDMVCRARSLVSRDTWPGRGRKIHLPP